MVFVVIIPVLNVPIIRLSLFYFLELRIFSLGE